MDTKRTCKICNRSFANGNAMGGHMRSHLVKHRLPPKPITPVHQQSQDRSTKSLSSSSSLNYPSSNTNAMQSYKSVNHDFATDFYEGESEEDSSKGPTRIRSKRSRKSADKASGSTGKVAEVSSISNNFTVEDVAMCLVMLSKNERTKRDAGVVRKRHRMEGVGAWKEEEEEERDDDDWFCETRTRYRCEKCNKGFPSYQALGGHKASHSRIKTHIQKEEESEEKGSDSDNINGGAVTGQSSFECPFCDKVFESGQALGGHKKVHFSHSPIATKSSGVSLLDLNLPAPDEAS